MFGDMMSMMGGGKGKGKGGDMMSNMMAMMFMKGMMGGKGGDMGGMGGGKGFGGKGFGGKPMRGPGSWGKYVLDEAGGVLGEYVGTIKSFSARTGYGFIECPDLKAMGYQDAFMHGDIKKDFNSGDTVKFTAFLTGKGQLQCKDLSAP
eukprot:TRINITY_DN868_c0_g4_i1.p1 TRINITY_DN868_c0_g4~~TRINITY_DN868_c0_g4_i1.p1  ORF type:complete len:148 (-),score=58.17 TRINITY_DN868_c0_g4_i1:177-620(-)